MQNLSVIVEQIARPQSHMNKSLERRFDRDTRTGYIPIVRGALTIIFSLLLLAGQFTAPLGAVEPSRDNKAACACLHCEKSCCVKESAPVSSESQPAVPAKTSQQNAWQLLIPHLVVFLLQDRQADAPPCPASVTAPSAAAVPLYDWNCSYLI